MEQWTGHSGNAKPEAQAQSESRDPVDVER
jgi:hypothetical protein